MDVLAVSTVVLVAAAIQGLAGYGYVILAVALIAILIGDFESAVVVCNATAVLQAAVMTWEGRRRAPVADALVVGAGVPFGGVLAQSINAQWMGAALGVGFPIYLIWYAYRKLRAPGAGAVASVGEPQVTVPHAARRLAGVGAGAFTGFVGYLTGATGPPLLVLAQYSRWDERRTRDFMQPIFFVATASACLLYWWGNVPVLGEDFVSFVCSPTYALLATAVIVGNLVGKRLNAAAEQAGRLQVTFYSVILLISLWLLAKQLGSLVQQVA